MKNDKKKIGFSPTKKIFSAAAMLAVSASMLATSTYAWFSMNTNVTATGMKVKAKAEGGIVISNSQQSTWASSATAQITSAELYPTSRTSASDSPWYHTSSDNADNYAKATSKTYETLTGILLSNTTEGIGYINNNGTEGYQANSTDAAYYLMNQFYIKSSGETLAETLKINNVSVTSDGSLRMIDASLRVAVVVGSTVYIYAPVTGTDSTITPNGTITPTYTYSVAGSGESTVCYKPDATSGGGTGDGAYGAGKNLATSVISISNTTPTNVKIYCYFEGEDKECKSTNISGITLDSLNVTVTFGTTNIN